MTKYSALRFLPIEIKSLCLEIEETVKPLTLCGLDPDADPCIALLNRSKTDCISQYNALMDELKAIQADDPEIYKYIYLHDLKGYTWLQVCNKSGLYTMCPEAYCRKLVVRYLERKGLTK